MISYRLQWWRRAVLALVGCVSAWAQDVGTGAPPGIDARFVNAYFRNNFSSLVSLPPLGPVRRFGPTGFLQEFRDAARDNNNKFAIVKADANLAVADGGIDTYHVYPALYSHYTAVGVANAGYPVMDTAACTSTTSGAAGSVCTWQQFTRNHALFSFSSSVLKNDASANYIIKELFFVRWNAAGGITAYGPPTTDQVDITSRAGTTATGQQFQRGAIYSITSGANSGRQFAVAGKVFELYNSLGVHTGSLGLPLSEELNAGAGRFRQNFEGGSVEYTATTDPVVRPAVSGVTLDIPTNSVVRLNLGETLTVRATVLATVGGALTDRDVTWVTSNGRVVSIQANGPVATLRALSGGPALITAVSEGRISPTLNVFVAAPCCQIGEGAPTAAIQQAFQDAVTRARLAVRLPAAGPVRREGTGFVQDLVSTDGSTRYLLCRSDRSPGVFPVVGDVLQAYLDLGGPTGRLAYPASDETATGRQMFEGGALAGRPVFPVRGAILARWETLGFETGLLGPPSSPAASVQSFTGVTASAQTFGGGLLIETLTGRFASAGAIFIEGAFLARYLGFGGPAGPLGLPVSDVYRNADAVPLQDFEGGQLRQGASEVEVTERERRPEIAITPARVTAGGRVRIIVGGFPPSSTLRISLPNQPAAGPPFEIATQQGSYSWEAPVPATARSGPVSVLAQDTATGAQASASYLVTALNEAAVQLTRVRGDTQSGLPGARLPAPLTIAVRGEQGAPLVGVPVRFAASPGSRIDRADAVTNDSGEAQAFVRLQPSDGVVLVTAEAAGRVVTFSARASAATLTNFPRQTQAGSFALGATSATTAQKGALLAAASSMLRFHQNRNELPTSLGLSEPALLNTFLRDTCILDTTGGRFCDGYLTPAGPSEPVVNLWRLRDFVGGNLDIEPLGGTEDAIRDTLGAGAPALVVLELREGDTVAGSHAVVAIGVAADGGIVLHDPNPTANRQRLSDYQSGIPIGGRAVRGVILDALRFVPRSPSPNGFLVTSGAAPIAVRSPRGECGRLFAWPAAAPLAPGWSPASGVSYIYYCPGLERVHAVELETESARAVVTGLSSPGIRTEPPTASFGLERRNGLWQPSPLDLTLAPGAVTNAATFTADLAPSSLAVITGTGLWRRGTETQVEIGGLPAAVVFSNEFQLNIEIPAAVLPGEQFLRIQSHYGSAEIAVDIRESAPAIFRDPQSGLPLLFNGAPTTPHSNYNPVARGGLLWIYATGLGAVRAAGPSLEAERPVRVRVQGRELPASAARVAALPGVFLVQMRVPDSLAPGLDVPLELVQGDASSSAVPVSIR